MPRLTAALISAAKLQMPSTPTRRFEYRLLCCWPLMVLSCGATGAAHAGEPRSVRAGLASAETAIAVVAGEHSPRLSSLSLRGATTWTNRLDEILPAQVEVRGSVQPVGNGIERRKIGWPPTGLATNPQLKVLIGSSS